MKKAFSLLELSVVILILGLMIAGIAQGGRLITKMRIASARSFTQASTVAAIPGLTLWLDATAEKSFSKLEADDGQSITNWYDVSPVTQKIIFTQATPLAKPTYVANAINGLPAINFLKSSSQYLGSSTAVRVADIASASEVTIFIVQKFISNSTSTFFWDGGGSTRINIHAFHEGSAAAYFDFGVCCNGTSRLTAGYSSTTENNKLRVISVFKKSSGAAEFRLNGGFAYMSTASAMTATLDSTATGNIYIGGAGPSNAGLEFSGYIAEIIVYNRAVTAEERQEVEQYLGKKWGIKIN